MKTLFTPLKTLSCAAAVSLLAACASSNPSGTPDDYYRVQSGDTLNRIAMRFNQTPAVPAKAARAPQANRPFRTNGCNSTCRPTTPS